MDLALQTLGCSSREIRMSSRMKTLLSVHPSARTRLPKNKTGGSQTLVLLRMELIFVRNHFTRASAFVSLEFSWFSLRSVLILTLSWRQSEGQIFGVVLALMAKSLRTPALAPPKNLHDIIYVDTSRPLVDFTLTFGINIMLRLKEISESLKTFFCFFSQLIIIRSLSAMSLRGVIIFYRQWIYSCGWLNVEKGWRTGAMMTVTSF